MQLEAVESSIIAFRGHDPESQTMQIVFRSRSTQEPTSHYEYRNIPAGLFQEGCNADSFGSWFQRTIKPADHLFPFVKLSDRYDNSALSTAERVAAHEETPAATQPSAAEDAVSEGDLKAKADSLLTQALSLAPGKTKDHLLAGAVTVSISTPAERERIVTLSLSLAAMRKGLSSVYDPKIADCHRLHKEAIADKSVLDKPLAAFEEVTRRAIGAYDAAVIRAEKEAAAKAREEEQRRAAEEAKAMAQELQLADAIAAEEDGDVDRAAQIIASPAPLVMPRFVAPVQAPSAIPQGSGISTVMVPDFEVVNEDLIPREYMTPNLKAIKARVDSLGYKAFDPEKHGIRVFEKPVPRRSGAKGRLDL